jgi:hypothetical protein
VCLVAAEACLEQDLRHRVVLEIAPPVLSMVHDAEQSVHMLRVQGPDDEAHAAAYEPDVRLAHTSEVEGLLPMLAALGAVFHHLAVPGINQAKSLRGVEVLVRGQLQAHIRKQRLLVSAGAFFDSSPNVLSISARLVLH